MREIRKVIPYTPYKNLPESFIYPYQSGATTTVDSASKLIVPIAQIAEIAEDDQYLRIIPQGALSSSSASS